MNCRHWLHAACFTLAWLSVGAFMNIVNCEQAVASLCKGGDCKCGALIKTQWECALSEKHNVETMDVDCAKRIDMEDKVREICLEETTRLKCDGEGKIISSCLRGQRGAVSAPCAVAIDGLHEHEMRMYHKALGVDPQSVSSQTSAKGQVGNYL